MFVMSKRTFNVKRKTQEMKINKSSSEFSCESNISASRSLVVGHFVCYTAIA